VTVYFIKEGFNTGNNNNMFKFMLTILGAVAEMERELTVERIREGLAKAKKVRHQIRQADALSIYPGTRNRISNIKSRKNARVQ